MARTKIDWADYSINPVKGLCPMACPYCYARRMYLNPFYKNLYQNREIRFDPNVMLDTGNISKPSRIFVGSTMELFGKWVRPDWMKSIFDWVKTDIGVHTYIFLTKQPQNLPRWSPFPENSWIGVSAVNLSKWKEAIHYLSQVKAGARFISAEPLLGEMPFNEGSTARMKDTLDWLIIGCQTPASAKTAPKIEWLQEIVKAADRARVPVFLKDNLNKVPNLHDEKTYTECPNLFSIGADYAFNLRQEFPEQAI